MRKRWKITAAKTITRTEADNGKEDVQDKKEYFEDLHNADAEVQVTINIKNHQKRGN